MKKEISSEVLCSYQCNDTTHQTVCALANDLCRCGHSRSIHIGTTSTLKSISQLVEEKLALEVESGVLISRARSGDDTSLNGGVIYTSLSKGDSQAYSWIDVRGNDMRPQGHDTSRPLSRSLSKKKFHMEEVLHPLERGYEVPRGRMVVVLQALRYVDLFFWPTPNRLRNEHLFNFISNLSSNLQDNSKKAKKMLPLSLYNAILRMSIYVAHGLSPFTQLAVLNIKRIHILMKNVDKVVPESCPRNEWIMIVITHILATLQRVHQAFYRLYSIIDLPYQTDLIPDGPLDSSQKQAEMKQLLELEENDKFYQFMTESDTIDHLDNIFYSPPGKLIIDYVCACIDVLISLKQSQGDLIAAVMGDKGFMMYSLVLEKHEKLLTKLPTLRISTRSRSMSKDVRDRLNSGTIRRDSLPRKESTSEESSPGVRRHSLSSDGERLRYVSFCLISLTY